MIAPVREALGLIGIQLGGKEIDLKSYRRTFRISAMDVIEPLVMPPLLTRVDDPVWVAVLALLALQSSFLLPPLGYAVMMARTLSPVRVDLHALVKALLPFLAAQLVVLGLTVAFPLLAHLALPAEPVAFLPKRPLTDREVEQRLFQQLPPPPYSDH